MVTTLIPPLPPIPNAFELWLTSSHWKLRSIFSPCDSRQTWLLSPVDVAEVMLHDFQGQVIERVQSHLFPPSGHLPLALSYHAVRKHKLTHMERSKWRAAKAPSLQPPPNTRHKRRSLQIIPAPSLWVPSEAPDIIEQRPAVPAVPIQIPDPQYQWAWFIAELGGNLLCIHSNWNKAGYHVNNTKEM